MLVLGMHPQEDIEAAVGRAYNRWLIERILPDDERIKGLLYLPFNSPKACEDIVRDFGDAKGVIGFTVTCTRNRPVHHDQYMKLYAMIEETGKPLAFHSGFHWGDPSFLQLNRFISMHALSFVHYQPHPPDQLGDQRPARALPEAQAGLGRERARLGALHHAAARPRVHDARVRGAHAQAAAERVHPRDVFHQPAAREEQHEAARGDLRRHEGRDAAAVRLRLAALGLRSAELDHHHSVPERAGQTQHILGLNAARAVQSGSEAKRMRPRARRTVLGGSPGASLTIARTQRRPYAAREHCAEFHGDRAMRLPRLAGRALADGALAVIAEQRPRARAHGGDRKLYAAKAEAEERLPAPVSADKITPTEIVLVVSELLRAADISLFDLAMWYRRGDKP